MADFWAFLCFIDAKVYIICAFGLCVLCVWAFSGWVGCFSDCCVLVVLSAFLCLCGSFGCLGVRCGETWWLGVFVAVLLVFFYSFYKLLY